MNTEPLNKVRIDKWLWAARFFKTRSLAKQAIEGGKVHVDGQRVKASRDITPGMVLQIRQGFDEREVIVKALSEQRRGAPEAALLYEETQESIARRELSAQQRKLAYALQPVTEGRPTKKQRRQIHQFKESQYWD
ncbi:ribosome-associated heat shock protein Hsp15 [Saccharophagus sp. K07]|jgi:ribosome-associated heat shock protein Hsp15|uniref:ribosome-associated heat shock protein Hsp15 n=1 Tax=Saccharophagus sp. K07 TaxID=2283636 RepID=UPI0016527B07|nr:ribosome-associated heat shock protein Hsp15 [Saccharophagus sp. K07]MBC6906413.1 ribosome-associated heat shock protein Hsp15 [Saccharophagus sp. K07]